MIDFRRQRLNRLSLRVKFTIITVLTVLTCFIVLAFLSNQSTTAQFERQHKEKAFLIWTHIIDDLAQGMTKGMHESMLVGTLDLYRAYEEVKDIRVFDHTGREVFNKEKGPPAPRLEETLRRGELVHFHQKINERPVDSYIIPINNGPACHRCHSKDESLRGALLLSLSTEKMEQEIAGQKRKFYFLFTLLAVAISGATILAVNRLFLKPLRRIQTGTEAIEAGDYRHQIPVKTKDEIGVLGKNFNRMAQTLQRKNEELGEQFELVSRAEKEWHQTFDCITDAIAVVDRDCVILRANRAFGEAFKNFFPGFPSEIRRQKCDQLFGVCLAPNCPHKMNLQNAAPMVTEILVPKTGRVFQISLSPYHSPKGELIGSVAILRDVSEQKENEFRLIMTERLAALGQMAAGIGHELNNPLATVSLSAEALLQRLNKGNFDPALFENYLKIIKEEMTRCESAIKSMLSYVKGKGNENGLVDIPTVLDRTVEMVSFLGRMRGVEVLRSYQEGMPLVPGNESELRQVLLTLIGNALDAMEERGKLTLEAGIDGDKALIKISDTGPGIPPDLFGKIFEPFFTTKSEKGGTGLGLSIAVKIIKKYNGQIEVTSEEGKGASFKIVLPL